MSSSQKSLRDTALKWAALGLSILPIRPDGTKAPAITEWTPLQESILTEEEIDRHFTSGVGIGIITGHVSSDLEVLDFDIPKNKDGIKVAECVYDEWFDHLDIELADLVSSMPTVRTPYGGYHLYYRCEGVDGNKKLALKKIPPPLQPPRFGVLIETRGDHGYVLAPGCPGQCHPSGKTYELISGSFESIPVITPEQRAELFAVAKSFDEYGLEQRKALKRDPSEHPAVARDGNRPGDEYNRKASWEDIIAPLGWTFAYHRRRDGAQCWRRPGKPRNEKGISATIREFEGLELFHSFSSNSEPLPHDKSITKFEAYTLIHHAGDFSAAAKDLASQGYGEPPRKPIDLDSVIDGKRDDSVPWNPPPEHTSSTKIVLDEEDALENSSIPNIPIIGPSEFDESVFHEELNPLDVMAFEDQDKLDREEKERKVQEKIKLRNIEMSKGPAYLVWRDYGDPPKKETTADGRVKTRVDKPRDTAWHILNDHFSSKDGVRKVHYHNEYFMMWDGFKYERLVPDAVRPSVSRFLSHFSEWKEEDEDGEDVYVPFRIRNTRVVEMMKTIQDLVYLNSYISCPAWLCDPKDGEKLPDPREIVCCKNGLLDIANRELLPPTPAFYSLNNTKISYDPTAPEPKQWLAFLESSLDKESRELLQQWFGYCLVQDTRLQKMLMVVGKPGSGKSVAMEVLRRLVGEESCCSLKFEDLDKRFSLQDAIGKSLILFPDARQGSKFDATGNAIGTILTVTGEDSMLVDRKNRDPVTTKLNAKIVVVSNDVMQLTDRSKALSRRMIWLKFPGFDGQPDPNLKKKLFDEISGILNWAIKGWAMVRKSGGFTQPQSAQLLQESFEEQSSDIGAFIDDMCEVDDNLMVEKVDLVNHWNAWRISKGYKKMGEAMFGKLLASAVMRLKNSRKRVGGRRINYYLGIGLDQNKVKEYADEYGGTETWKDLIRTIGVNKESRNADIVTIQEFIDRKKKS